MKQTKKEIMDGIDNIKARVIAPNTVEYSKSDGTRVIRFHNTDILIFTVSGTITINSGGWYTLTTKARLNFFLPFDMHVTQRKGMWYLHHNGQSYIYKDGMRILKSGTVVGAETSARIKKVEKRKKQIKKYVDGYMKKLLAGKIPTPSGGDCWDCALFAQNRHKTSPDHLIAHFKERYYVPSLIVRAIEAYPVSLTAKSVLGHLFQGKTDFIMCADQLKKSLYRYICRQFDIAV